MDFRKGCSIKILLIINYELINLLPLLLFFLPPIIFFITLCLLIQSLALMKQKKKRYAEIFISLLIVSGVITLFIFIYNTIEKSFAHPSSIRFTGNFLNEFTVLLFFSVTTGAFFIRMALRFKIPKLFFISTLLILIVAEILVLIFSFWFSALQIFILISIFIFSVLVLARFFNIYSQISDTETYIYRQIINLIIGGLFLVIVTGLTFYYAFLYNVRFVGKLDSLFQWLF